MFIVSSSKASLSLPSKRSNSVTLTFYPTKPKLTPKTNRYDKSLKFQTKNDIPPITPIHAICRLPRQQPILPSSPNPLQSLHPSPRQSHPKRTQSLQTQPTHPKTHRLPQPHRIPLHDPPHPSTTPGDPPNDTGTTSIPFSGVI